MYDPKPLQEAKTLLQASMNTFDDPENRERMQQEMEEVRARAAEEAVAMARFWEHKGKPAAAAIYHELLLRNYPDTPVAEESKEFLSKLDPKYRQGILNDYPEKAEEPEIQQASAWWKLGGRRRRTVAPPEDEVTPDDRDQPRTADREEAEPDRDTSRETESDEDDSGETEADEGLPQEFNR